MVIRLKKKLKVCAILATLATGTIYIMNRIIYYLSTIDNLLGNTEGNYYEWRFGKIFYKKQGEGKPILLIHDLNAHSSGYEWKKVTSALAEYNTVYTIDLLGCGRSDKPNITYTNFLYVQMINDFIKHIICDKVDVIATGESASFVVMACNTGEDTINRIAMVNPSSLYELAKIPTKRTKTLKFLINIPILGTLLYNILQSQKSLDEVFTFQYFYDDTKIDNTIVKTYYEAAHTDKIKSKFLFASIKGRFTRANISSCIGNITNSIYIISGKENSQYEETAEQYKHFVPAIETISIPDTKYLPQLERPSAFIEQIKIFFDIE